MKKKDYINILIIYIFCILIIFSVTKLSNTFGSNTDWISQHTIFPEYLREMFYKTHKLIPDFSFNYGAGQNIFNISYYGLLSPLILPSYLFPNVSMTTYMTITNILTIFLSVFLFYKWLHNNRFKTNICFVSTLLFVLTQAFIFQFHRHIMFVNYMPFLIMCLIGVDKLVTKNNKSFFVISLFLTIMTSYYYSVSGILVIGCYFIFRYLIENKKFNKKDFIKSLIKIILLGLLAITMSCVLLLPTIHTILISRADSTSTTKLIDLFIPYLRIHKIFCGTYAIGYSMLGYVGLLYMFFKKEKKYVIPAILVTIILFIPIFRYLLNGGLYLREKCFIPFLPFIGYMVTIFLDDLFNNKIDSKKFSLLLIIISTPLYFFNRKQYCYLFLIGLVLLVLLNSKIRKKVFISIFLVSIMFYMSLRENLMEEFVSIDEYKEYFNNQYENDINNIIEKDNSFYRISNLKYPSITVNKIYNSSYYTTSFYSSTYNYYYLNFVRNIFKINNPDFNYFFISSSDNVLFDTYMGVKYIYSDYDSGLPYEQLQDKVYINNNTYPILYHTSNLLNEKDFDKIEYPYSIEALMKNAVVNLESNTSFNSTIEKEDLEYEITDLDEENVTIKNIDGIIQIDAKKDTTFKIKLNKTLYNKLLFINLYGINKNGCTKIGNTYININNIKNLMTCYSWIYPNKNDVFHYVISDEELNELTIDIGKGKYTISNIETYILDYDNIKLLNNQLNPLNISKINDNSIEGNINVEENGYFITSIPYDDGFIVKVNEKIIEKEIVNKAFLGFKLNKGNYNIEITYHTPWLKEGKIISIISIIIFFIILYTDIKQKKFNK